MLDRADYPEQVGVDSDVVSDLIKFFEKLVYNIDSLMVIRHGKVACECHWAPNRVDTPHDMYSLSKSVTATAIGIAVDEGYISLDTRIYEKYFPHKLDGLTGKQLEWAKKVTVHDVLSMRMGKVTSVFDDKAKTDWVNGILDKPIQFEPNSDWKYISENAYLLSWILQRETGMTMTEYLTPRLYEPLDIKIPHWEKSQVDVDAGGWPRTLLKFHCFISTRESTTVSGFSLKIGLKKRHIRTPKRPIRYSPTMPNTDIRFGSTMSITIRPIALRDSTDNFLSCSPIRTPA